MGGSDECPMKSHDWSHAQPAGPVGGDMDGNLSQVPLDWQWWHIAGDKCSRWPTQAKIYSV